jgi:hypothetical protein
VISDRLLISLTGSRRFVALTGDLVRVFAWIAAAAALFGAIVFLIPHAWQTLQALHFNDFGRFYYATVLFEQGRDMYGTTVATPVPLTTHDVVQLLDLNPPHFHLLVLPLIYLPIERAFAVWAVVSAVCAGVSLTLIARELRMTWTASGAAWAIVWTVASAATIATITTGQLTFVLLLPMTLAWRAARRGRWREAGVCLGILVSVKLFLGLFALYFALSRRWIALAWMIAASAGMCALGLIVFGAPAYVSWLHALGAVSWPWLPMNASIAGLMSRAFDGLPVFAPLMARPSLVQPCVLASSIVLVVSTLWVARGSGSRASVDLAFARLILVGVLASPVGWIYYLWLGAGPLAGAWTTIGGARSRARLWLVAAAVPGLFMPIALTLRGASYAWAGVTIGSIYTWSVLLLWTATMITARDSAARLDT